MKRDKCSMLLKSKYEDILLKNQVYGVHLLIVIF